MKPEIMVIGAGGTVGFGIVGALLEVGSPVLAVGRDGTRMRALAEHFAGEPALSLMRSGGVMGDAAAARLAARVRRRRRPLHAVIASIASPPVPGRMLDRPADCLLQQLRADVVPHLAAARHLLPVLAEGGQDARYILIGGPQPQHGWAGYGHASVAIAAVRMLAQVLHQEARLMGVRVQLLAVEHPVSTPENAINACAEWPSALAVGRCAVSMLTRGGPSLPIVPFSEDCALPASTLMFADAWAGPASGSPGPGTPVSS